MNKSRARGDTQVEIDEFDCFDERRGLAEALSSY